MTWNQVSTFSSPGNFYHRDKNYFKIPYENPPNYVYFAINKLSYHGFRKEKDVINVYFVCKWQR